MPVSRKTVRLSLRLTRSDHALIREAAARTGATLSDFTIGSARRRAHEVLADEPAFATDPRAWDALFASMHQVTEPDRVIDLRDPSPAVGQPSGTGVDEALRREVG